MIRAIQRAIMVMPTAPSRVSTRVAVGTAIRCALEGACQGSRSCDNMRMWGARAVRSLNVVLRRFAPSARHRLRALARASRLLSGEQTLILNGVMALTLPLRVAPLRLLGRSRSAWRVPHAMPIMPLRLPTPSR